jgi:serine/threonine-protein kinase
MSEVAFDETLVRRLPLPLARLYAHYFNAAGTHARHSTALLLWEVTFRLLGSVGVVEYAASGRRDEAIDGDLKNLVRPSFGHWRGLVRALVAHLADAGDPGFQSVDRLIHGPAVPPHEVPRLAALDSTLREALGKPAQTNPLNFGLLFDRVVQYRNSFHGHAGVGESGKLHRRHRVLLEGAAELLGRVDVVAGRRLLYIEELKRERSGHWLVGWGTLAGENYHRKEMSCESGAIPGWLLPERIYLDQPAPPEETAGPVPPVLTGRELTTLHPLAVYDPALASVVFLSNGTSYLSYDTGAHVTYKELAQAQRDFFSRLVGTKVDSAQIAHWADAAEAGAAEPAEPDVLPGAVRSGPTQVGESELREVMGSGSVGTVYRAWQPSIRRIVALKYLDRATSAKARGRFEREIVALGQVDHPNLVKILTSGFDEDPPFYTMELVEGATLAAVGAQLRERVVAGRPVSLAAWGNALIAACRGPGPVYQAVSTQPAGSSKDNVPAAAIASPAAEARSYVPHAVDLIRQVALAAEALHQKGIVHRDIAPSNIMITADDRRAVLMDLGLAQLADRGGKPLTEAREIVGTLRYASPEQVLAIGGVDRRSDVFGLGAVLWELLTLRPLYEDDESVSVTELIGRITRGDVAGASKYRKEIPRDLELIISKCLETNPNCRYATAAELADDLGCWLGQAPVKAHPPTLAYVLRKTISRHRFAFAATGFLAVAAATWVAAFVYTTRQARARAERNFQLALDTTSDVSQLADDLKSIAGAKTTTVERILRRTDASYKQLLREVGPSPPVLEGHARMLSSFSDVYLSAGNTDEARATASTAYWTYRDLAARAPGVTRYDAGIGKCLEQIGLAELNQGKIEDAMGKFRESSVIRKRLAAQPGTSGLEGRADLATSLHLIGAALEQQGDAAGAARAFEQAYDIRKQLAAKDRSRTRWKGKLASSEERKARVLDELGQTGAARNSYEKSLALYEELASDEPQNVDWQRSIARLLTSIGVQEQGEGRAEQAIDSLREALSIAQRFVALDPNDAEWRRQVFECELRLSDIQKTANYVQALQEQLTVLRGFEPVLQDQRRKQPHYVVWARIEATTKRLIGVALTSLAGAGVARADNLREALVFLDTARKLDQSNAGVDPTDYAAASSLFATDQGISEALRLEGDEAGARAAAIRARTLLIGFLKRQSVRDPTNPYWWERLAQEYAQLGRTDTSYRMCPEAVQAFQDALRLSKQLADHDRDNPRWLRQQSDILDSIGNVRSIEQQLTGDPDARNAAIASAQQSVAILKTLIERQPADAEARLALADRFRGLIDDFLIAGDRAAAEKAYRDWLDALEAFYRLDRKEAESDLISPLPTSLFQRQAVAALEERGLRNLRRIVAIAEQLYRLDASPLRATELVDGDIRLVRRSEAREARKAALRALALLQVLEQQGETHKVHEIWGGQLRATLKKLPAETAAGALDGPAQAALDGLDYGRLAAILLAQGRGRDLVSVLDREAHDALVMTWLTQPLEQIAREPKAVTAIVAAARDAVKDDPKQLGPAGRTLVARLASLTGDTAAAAEFDPDVAKAQRDFSSALSDYAELLKNGRLEDAIAKMQSLVDSSTSIPIRTMGYREMARAQLATGKLDDAARSVTQAIEAMPGAPENQLLLGMVYAQQRRFTAALEVYAKLLAPGGPKLRSTALHEIALSQAAIASERGDRDVALALIRKVLQEDPKNVAAQATLAEVLATLGGDLGEAETAIKAALTTLPDMAPLQFIQAVILTRRGQAEKAIPILEKTSEDDSLARNPATFDELGDAYLKVGKSDQAREAWRKAVALFPATTEDSDRRKRQIEEKLKALDRSAPAGN